MNHSHSQLVYESLLLGIELLRGGNSAVQSDMYRIITSPEQHGFGFLDAIRKRIAWSVTDIREAKRFIKQFVYVSNRPSSVRSFSVAFLLSMRYSALSHFVN